LFFQQTAIKELYYCSNFSLYDPALGRMLSPDNYITDPHNPQAYNRYTYALNNPLKYVDPDGEFIFTALAVITGQWWALPIAIGADLGMWQGGSLANGTINPLKWDYSSGKTWGYMAAGAAVGAASAYVGWAIATEGGFMANTMGIVTSSYINSLGTSIYTGGKTDVSVNFGFGSYNFGTGDFSYLFDGNNKWYEDLGYFLGAMGNLNDVWNVAFPNQKGTNLYTDKEDPIISHTAWGDSESKADALISFGPDNDNPFFYERWKGQGVSKFSFGNQTAETVKSYSKFALGVPRKSAYWDYSHYNNWELAVTNINKIPLKGVSYLSKVLPYQGLTLNCVNIGSLGAWVSGIPNIGLHPWLFHGYMQLYTMGMRPDLFGYYLTSKYY